MARGRIATLSAPQLRSGSGEGDDVLNKNGCEAMMEVYMRAPTGATMEVCMCAPPHGCFTSRALDPLSPCARLAPHASRPKLGQSRRCASARTMTPLKSEVAGRTLKGRPEPTLMHSQEVPKRSEPSTGGASVSHTCAALKIPSPGGCQAPVPPSRHRSPPAHCMRQGAASLRLVRLDLALDLLVPLDVQPDCR